MKVPVAEAKYTLTIIVPANGFIGWGGGVDYLKLQLKLLLKICEDYPSIKILLLMPNISFAGKFIRTVKSIIKRVIRFSITTPFDGVSLLVSDQEIKDKIKIISYCSYKKHGSKSVQKIVKDQINPLVFLTFYPLPNLCCKQIGYIPDLQHISMPQFFTQDERLQRDVSFKHLLAHCDGIIVNSKYVKDHLLSTYPEQCKKTNIFSSPFVPIADDFFLHKAWDISAYNLPEKYFIIANQLWMHKDHKTAFKALRLLHNNGFNDVAIICTGETYDYRFPRYYQELQDYIAELNLTVSVRFLGFIPKNDQIAILKRSVGLVQPTLFEGGPGGGSVYDAVAYGVPSIVSDITINREIEHPLVSFFNTGNHVSLCKKMTQILDNPPARPSIKDLDAQKTNNIAVGACSLKTMFYTVDETYNFYLSPPPPPPHTP
jgi:glycosyltransferase involved in cell wall biosynthesis